MTHQKKHKDAPAHDKSAQPQQPHDEAHVTPTTATVGLPVLAPNAGWRAKYEHWVLTHTSLARNVETALYIVPQIVPKSIKDPEVATQGGYSMVGLLGLYHDYIMYMHAHKDDKHKSNAMTRLVRVPLSIVSHVQVLAEVTARKYGGEVGRWRIIVWIELFKSVCKVLLVLQQRQSLLIGAGKYKTIHPPGTKKSPFARFSKSKKKAGSRTGKVFGANKTKTVDEAPEEPAPAGPTAITFDDPTFAVADVSRAHLLLSGELLHIFRPVAYALLRQRKEENSWLPAIVAVLMELSGLVLTGSAFEEEGFSASPKSIVAHKKAQEELQSRKMALLLYLLRDPVYAQVTKPVTEKMCGAADYVPVFGKLFRLVSLGLMDYYNKYHFYTAAS